MLDAERPQVLHGGTGAAANLIAKQQPAEELLVAADSGDRAIVDRRRRRGDTDALEEVGASERHCFVPVLAGDAESPQLARVIEREALFLGHCSGGGPAQRMVAGCAEARAQLAQRIRIDAIGGSQLDEAQVPGRHGAGLVEDHGRNIRQMLQEGGALDEDAMTSGDRDGRHSGGGRGQHEGTRARSNEYSQHGRHIGRDEPGARGYEQNQRHVLAGVAIQQARHRRFGVLRVLHQGNDATERALLADPRQLHLEQAIDVHRSGKHFVALAHLDRHRLAGDRGQIQARCAAPYQTVRRNALTGAQLDQVADAQAHAGDDFHRSVGEQPPGVHFREASQGADGLVRTEHAALFEHVADGHDDRQERSGHQVARGPGGDQSQCDQTIGDPMQARVTQALPRLHENRDRHERRGGAGHQLGDPALRGNQKTDARGHDQQT